jgi:hypothetical protein
MTVQRQWLLPITAVSLRPPGVHICCTCSFCLQCLRWLSVQAAEEAAVVHRLLGLEPYGTLC